MSACVARSRPRARARAPFGCDHLHRQTGPARGGRAACGPGRAEEVPVDPWSDALYIGTSGSTAASKIVAQSHLNGAANAAGLIAHRCLRPGDRLLGCLPIHHVNGLHFTVFGALAAGAHVLLADVFHPFTYPRLLDGFQPRVASVVPSILEALHRSWRLPAPPPRLEYFVSAAAPLTAGIAGAVLDRIGVPVLQGYGPHRDHELLHHHAAGADHADLPRADGRHRLPRCPARSHRGVPRAHRASVPRIPPMT